jgi:ProQ/FINO family
MPTLTAPASARAAAAKRGLPSGHGATMVAPAHRERLPKSGDSSIAPVLSAMAKTGAPEISGHPSSPRFGGAEPKSPSKKQKKSAEYMARQRAFQASAREKLLPMLREVFPQAFPLPPVPLAIGIHREILAIAGDEIDPADLSAFLRYWCTRRSYLTAIWRGQGRRNLDGSIAGVPTIKERNDAGRGVWRDRYRPIEEPTEEKIREEV